MTPPCFSSVPHLAFSRTSLSWSHPRFPIVRHVVGAARVDVGGPQRTSRARVAYDTRASSSACAMHHSSGATGRGRCTTAGRRARVSQQRNREPGSSRRRSASRTRTRSRTSCARAATSRSKSWQTRCAGTSRIACWSTTARPSCSAEPVPYSGSASSVPYCATRRRCRLRRRRRAAALLACSGRAPCIVGCSGRA